VIVDTRGILNDPENWDERLQPQSSTLIDDMHNVHGCTTGSSHINQIIDHDSDQHDTTTRNPDSQLPSSDLTPLDKVEEIQMSGAHRLMQLSKRGSLVIDRGTNRANCEPISSDMLHTLEEYARLANKRLQIAHNEHIHRNNSFHIKSDSRSTSPYNKINIDHSHNERIQMRISMRLCATCICQ
jgi:hypothetical protein